METPPSFIDLADEEAYNQARRRLTCDYCGKNYFCRNRLSKPFEVHSSSRSVKRWVIVCKICAVMIYLHEKKKGTKKTKTGNYFFLEDPTLYRGGDEDSTHLEPYDDKDKEEEDLLQPKEDHEF
jgi:hypothetical protein